MNPKFVFLVSAPNGVLYALDTEGNMYRCVNDNKNVMTWTLQEKVIK